MKFADWLELKDEFTIEGTLVTIVEVPSLNEVLGPYRKFRVSWENPNGMSSVRYVLALNKRDAFQMTREDLVQMIRDRRSADPYARLPAGSPITGHKDVSKITVQPVDNIEEVINMIKRLYKKNLGIITSYIPGKRVPDIDVHTIDAIDARIMLNALVRREITNPDDYLLVKNFIDILKVKNPSIITFKDNRGVVNDRNWQLLRKLRQQPSI